MFIAYRQRHERVYTDLRKQDFELLQHINELTLDIHALSGTNVDKDNINDTHEHCYV